MLKKYKYQLHYVSENLYAHCEGFSVWSWVQGTGNKVGVRNYKGSIVVGN